VGFVSLTCKNGGGRQSKFVFVVAAHLPRLPRRRSPGGPARCRSSVVASLSSANSRRWKSLARARAAVLSGFLPTFAPGHGGWRRAGVVGPREHPDDPCPHSVDHYTHSYSTASCMVSRWWYGPLTVESLLTRNCRATAAERTPVHVDYTHGHGKQVVVWAPDG